MARTALADLESSDLVYRVGVVMSLLGALALLAEAYGVAALAAIALAAVVTALAFVIDAVIAR